MRLSDRRHAARCLALSALLAAMPAGAEGIDLCVDSVDGLRDALNTWTATPDAVPVTIRLVRGTYAYDTAGGHTLGLFQAGGNASLALLGGYAPGCGAREIDPRNTVIDGRGELGSRLQLISINGDALIEGVGFTGLTSGLELIHRLGSPAALHRLGLRHCRVVANSAVNLSGSPYTLRLWGFGDGDGATVALENSVVARNVNGTTGTPVVLTTGSNGTVRVTNSTIARNTAGFGGAGIVLQSVGGIGGIVFEVHNDIFWGNTGIGWWSDVDVGAATQPPTITYTLAGIVNGAIAPTTTNLDGDPRFLSAANLRLGTASPALDAGTPLQPGGLPLQDLDGRPRVLGAGVDLGAYESVPGDAIFYADMGD